jgi:hypothetical protein
MYDRSPRFAAQSPSFSSTSYKTARLIRKFSVSHCEKQNEYLSSYIAGAQDRPIKYRKKVEEKCV